MSVASTFAIVLVLIVVGRLLRWRHWVPDNAADTLNLVVLNVCLPAAILLHAPKLQFEPELVGLVAVPWIILAASIALVLPISKWLHFEADSKANLLLQIPLGNTSFIGYSLIPVLVSADALRYAVVYDQLGSFLILATWGLFVVASYAHSARPGVGVIARRVLGFPPFIALVVALTLMPSDPRPAVEHGLRLLADALLPMVILALGMQLRLHLPRRHLLPLLIGLAGKLVIMPLLALGLCRIFDLPAEITLVAVLLTAMPPMMTSAALLSTAGLAPELATALVGYGTILSIATLPVWHWLLAA